MKAFARHETVSGPRQICSHCGHRIVDVPHVGWVAPMLGDSYDVCDGDAYVNHLPPSVTAAAHGVL